MLTIKNRLDFIVKEEQKRPSLSIFKQKNKTPKKIKDISSSVDKIVNVQKQTQEQNKNITVVDNMEKKIRPLKTLIEKKKKPTVWL
jgi:translation initiation factor 1 (eIF-1/SUI1)